MSNFVQIIKACENAGGAGSKLAIREALATTDEVAHRLIFEALNVYRVYGVKKFIMPRDLGMMHVPRDPTFERFFDLLDKLASRELTGNAARDAVTCTLAFYDEETATYLARVIDKDLKAGFSADTYNNVLIARESHSIGPDNGTFEQHFKIVKELLNVKGIRQFSNYKVFPLLVPTFEVQLADKCETEEDYAALQYPAQADVKYDGERNIAVVQKDAGRPVIHLSRSGREAEHMGEIEEITFELMRIREELGYDFILDGERFADDFTQTMNAKKSGNGEAKAAMKIRAYFLMPLDHWLAQETDITMGQCREFLGALLDKLQLKRIILSEGRIVKDHHDMMNFANEVIDGKFNGRKEEGLIRKELDAVYRWERNASWMKVKRFYPVDLRVVGWYYGNPGSRLAKVMGGVIAEGTDEKGKKFRTRIGSGWNDKQRENPDALKDITIEVKYQEISQGALAKKAKSDIFQLRFPTVERIRDDKKVPALQDQRWWGVTLQEAVKICGGLQ